MPSIIDEDMTIHDLLYTLNSVVVAVDKLQHDTTQTEIIILLGAIQRSLALLPTGSGGGCLHYVYDTLFGNSQDAELKQSTVLAAHLMDMVGSGFRVWTDAEKHQASAVLAAPLVDMVGSGFRVWTDAEKHQASIVVATPSRDDKS